MSERRHAQLTTAILLSIAAAVVFVRLSTAPFETYDEGLYGMYARNALEHDVWLHAADATGQFPTGQVKFSKPPLSIWLVAGSMRVFGPSLFALRLPFALATLAMAWLVLGFARLLEPGVRGDRLGFVWGLLLICTHGVTHYGRSATIEPLLVTFVLLALYGYARGLRSITRARFAWLVLSGVAIGLAFMTKQLVCVLALVPIVLVEALHARRVHPSSLTRLAIVIGIPLAIAASWIAALVARVGQSAWRVLWKHAIVVRASGFDGIHHQNYLNRVADLLDHDVAPMSWPIGLFGLALMLTSRSEATRRHRDVVWLLTGFLGCAWLAFDVGSRAILPWYAYSLLPTLALGQAWLVSRALSWGLEAWPDTPHEQVAAACGVIAVMLCVAEAARAFMPSIAAVALASLAFSIAIARVHGPAARRNFTLAGAAGAASLVWLAVFMRPEYRATEAPAFVALGRELFERGALSVTVDDRAAVHPYARATFLGTRARRGPAPWLGSSGKLDTDACVRAELLPNELSARPGTTFLRAAGMYAVLGSLSRPPFSADALSRALQAGPLTFEAEHMGSEHLDTLASMPGASGDEVRRSSPRMRERAQSFALARGTTPRFPAGHYELAASLRLRCEGYRGEQLGKLRVSSRGTTLAERVLDCKSQPGKADALGFSARTLSFELPGTAVLDLLLQVEHGEVALDFMRLQRLASPVVRR